MSWWIWLLALAWVVLARIRVKRGRRAADLGTTSGGMRDIGRGGF
jgi:hypothetical protein